LISHGWIDALDAKESAVEAVLHHLSMTNITPAKVNPIFERRNESPITENDLLIRVLRRTNVTAEDVAELITDESTREYLRDKNIRQQVEIDAKYEGYIKRQNEQIQRFAKLEEYLIPEHFDYSIISSLSTEGKEKLQRIRPRSIGQASRISGVTNSDVSVLSIFLKQHESTN
jgi:tRNA uridine 5-carboxymethylaminomethyl modification enzyme